MVSKKFITDILIFTLCLTIAFADLVIYNNSPIISFILLIIQLITFLIILNR
jgi:hypothetical protein